MNLTEFQLDASEVRDLRHLLFGNEVAEGAERRGNQRFPFSVVQLALPLHPGRPIGDQSICKVQCFDLSRGGIAFYWPEKPDFTHVCIGLGCKERVAWVKARVVHSRQVLDPDSRFLVGCLFVERVDSRFLAESIAAKAAQQIGESVAARALHT